MIVKIRGDIEGLHAGGKGVVAGRLTAGAHAK